MPTMNFTTEEEVNNKINFLDITISKENNVSFDIYRKSTATDTIIPQDSCHPTEHKIATIRYLKNRNDTYILNDNNKQKENEAICHILCNNKYDTSTLNKCKRTDNKKENETNTQGQKWDKFTYIGKETRTITKLFRDSNIKIAFTTKKYWKTSIET
jgi:hypothetical protein